jgi:hypothetical protein
MLHEREVGCHFDPAAPLIGGGGQFIPDPIGSVSRRYRPLRAVQLAPKCIDLYFFHQNF